MLFSRYFLIFSFLLIQSVFGQEPLVEELDSSRGFHLVFEKKHDLFSSLAIQYESLEGAIDIKDDQGKTLLHLAAYLGDLKMVKELVRLGAELDAETESKNTPLDFARSSHFKDSNKVVDFLERKKAKANNTGYVGAFSREGIKKTNLGISSLLNIYYNKEDIEYKDKQDKMFLHLAASLGDLNTVKKLVKDRANVNARTKSKNTPLDFTRRGYFKESELVKVFLRINGALDSNRIIEFYRSL